MLITVSVYHCPVTSVYCRHKSFMDYAAYTGFIIIGGQPVRSDPFSRLVTRVPI